MFFSKSPDIPWLATKPARYLDLGCFGWINSYFLFALVAQQPAFIVVTVAYDVIDYFGFCAFQKWYYAQRLAAASDQPVRYPLIPTERLSALGERLHVVKDHLCFYPNKLYAWVSGYTRQLGEKLRIVADDYQHVNHRVCFYLGVVKEKLGFHGDKYKDLHKYVPLVKAPIPDTQARLLADEGFQRTCDAARLQRAASEALVNGFALMAYMMFPVSQWIGLFIIVKAYIFYLYCQQSAATVYTQMAINQICNRMDDGLKATRLKQACSADSKSVEAVMEEIMRSPSH